MILSVSRRTDIPCYYSEWFINRIHAGYAMTRNPMNPSQISKLPLSPDVIDCIVFWTKDAQNIMDKLPILDELGYKYYFQFTLTPYDKSIEKSLRNKADIEATFINLSKKIGENRVLWRYDPIILNEHINIKYHKDQFKRMCEKLAPFTESVTISFVDIYSKLKTHLIREITESEIVEISEFIGDQAKQYGLVVKACSEKFDLSPYGITSASCIDREVIEKACGSTLRIKSDKNQRQGCKCLESIDIGVYNTCKNSCIYCYANYSEHSVRNNFNKHHPYGEFLIGELRKDEKVNLKKLTTNKNK